MRKMAMVAIRPIPTRIQPISAQVLEAFGLEVAITAATMPRTRLTIAIGQHRQKLITEATMTPMALPMLAGGSLAPGGGGGGGGGPPIPPPNPPGGGGGGPPYPPGPCGGGGGPYPPVP